MTLRELTSRHADRLIAAGLGALYCVEIATESHFAGDRAVSFPAALAFCAALAWRRRAPLVALALAVVIIELSNLAAPALAETGAFLVGILVAIYSAGRYTRGRALIVGVALVVVAIPLAAIEPGDPVAFTDIAFFAVLFGGPWVVGRYARHRSERERVLVAERDVRAQEAVAEERTRIARELHDVVAHAISLIVLQARGGRRMLPDDPAETRRGARRHRARRRAGAGRDAPPARAAARRTSPSCRSRRRRACAASTSSSPAPAPRACRSRSSSRASRSSCRPASTSRPTGSCRRR